MSACSFKYVLELKYLCHILFSGMLTSASVFVVMIKSRPKKAVIARIAVGSGNKKHANVSAYPAEHVESLALLTKKRVLVHATIFFLKIFAESTGEHRTNRSAVVCGNIEGPEPGAKEKNFKILFIAGILVVWDNM